MINLFGLEFNEASIWLLGIAGALGTIYLSTLITSTRSDWNAARKEYINSFSDVLLNLRENVDCPLAQIAHTYNPQIIAASNKRRNEIMCWQRKNFDIDLKRYKEQFLEATQYGSVTALVLSEKTEYAIENRKRFERSIKKLLTYA